MARYNVPELKTIVETYKGVPLNEPNCPEIEGPLKEGDFGSIEVKVGRIEDAYLGFKDGYLVLDLTVEGSGWGIIFPCYLASPTELGVKNTSVDLTRGLYDLLKFFGISNFNDLKGQYLRVEYKVCGTIHRFYHIMEDKSFSWEDYERSK